MFLSKYKKTNGKYGPIYNVTRGINVRKTHEGKWLVVTQKYRIRRSKSNQRGSYSQPPLLKTVQDGSSLHFL